MTKHQKYSKSIAILNKHQAIKAKSNTSVLMKSALCIMLIPCLPNIQSQVNCHDEDSLTPLHYAARYNHLEIVQLLVAKGAGERFIPVLASGIAIFFKF